MFPYEPSRLPPLSRPIPFGLSQKQSQIHRAQRHPLSFLYVCFWEGGHDKNEGCEPVAVSTDIGSTL